MAKILHFYNGLSLTDVLELDVKTTDWLYRAITQIEAQEMLKQFEVVCYPKLKSNQDRNRLYKKYYRLAYPKKKVQKSTTEMAQELQRMFGG